ncbi:MAG: Bcr/CflA family drug resistance efflux transporter, partial [Burkholderiaceae bacterium]
MHKPDHTTNQAIPAAPSQVPHPGLSASALAIMLAALAMLGPFAVDTYLPAFPDIQATLNASAIQVQQTLTAYMLSF